MSTMHVAAETTSALATARSDACLRQQTDELWAFAEEQGRADAANGIDPMEPAASIGYAAIDERATAGEHTLQDIQAGELGAAHVRSRGAADWLERLTSWRDDERLPPGVSKPRQQQRGVISLLVVMFAIETWLLVAPLKEVLLAGTRVINEAVGGALLLTGVATLAAHFRATLRAEAVTSLGNEESRRLWVKATTVVLVVFTIAAVFARTFSAMLDQHPVGIAAPMFSLVQVALVGGLVLATEHLVRARRRADQDTLALERSAASLKVHEANEALDQLKNHHARQLQQWRGPVTAQARLRWLSTLVEEHRGTWVGDQLQMYTSRFGGGPLPGPPPAPRTPERPSAEEDPEPWPTPAPAPGSDPQGAHPDQGAPMPPTEEPVPDAPDSPAPDGQWGPYTDVDDMSADLEEASR